MATKTRSDLPEGSPAIIFKGTVKKIKSATMKEVPLSDCTAVVRVDQVIEAPRTFAHCGGQENSNTLCKSSDAFFGRALTDDDGG